MVLVRGTTSTNAVLVSPPESRTVSRTRYQTLAAVSPVVGMVKLPEVMPVVGCRNGCVCVSWWKSICQVKAEAGSMPSSGSAPVPEKVKLSPAVYSVLWAGAVMVAVGASFAVTVSVAELLVTLPESLLTTTRKVAPSSASVTPLMVKLEAVAPAMFTPLRCHW
jgi:hypothetical protein